MASTTVEIPSFDFTSFYYPQILEALIQYKRINVPELTDESEFEPLIQMLRAFALVGHLNNTLVDLVANESTLPTAQLAETVRNMLRLIDYELSPATPGQAELLYELNRVLSASTQVINSRAQASTRNIGDDPVIFYEANSAFTVSPTNALGAAKSDDGGTFTDRLTAIVDTLPASDFAPWGTPAIGDAVYFGHPEVMFDKLTVQVPVASAGINGVWEFYEGDFLKAAPDSVSVLGSTLTVNLNGLLGTSPVPNTKIRVTLNETGAFEETVSQWNGSQNFVTVGLLGQSSPSTTAADYSVGSDWTIIDDVDDGTADLTQNGDVSYTIPQSTTKNWKVTEVDGTEAYWLRYRVTVASGGPTSPTLRHANITSAKTYVIRLATQGRTVLAEVLGSSTGLADQRFETSRDNFIVGSATVRVDAEEWTQVDDFLNSRPTDKHYRVELGDEDRATIVFGSGLQGLIPPIGANNVEIDYRFGAQDDGNVGPDTITVDKQGLTYVNSITNPRQANGWQEADGADEASLERAKIAGPASLRIKETAIGPDDVEELTTDRFTDDLGSSPYGRALAIEEGLGAKTIKLVVVLKGGGLATTEQLETLGTYFNGDKFADPPLPKRIVANQEVTAFNYTPRSIDITATVTTRATADAIANRLRQIIQPEALKDDGVTFEWDFGSSVPLSRIIHEIHDVDESTVKVDLISPVSDIVLAAEELPVAGTLTITVIEP